MLTEQQLAALETLRTVRKELAPYTVNPLIHDSRAVIAFFDVLLMLADKVQELEREADMRYNHALEQGEKA